MAVTNKNYLDSKSLLLEEEKLRFTDLSILDFIEIGNLATLIGIEKKLPLAIELRLGDWPIYHASLPGSTV